MAYFVAMMTYIIYLAFRKQQIGVLATTVTIFGFASQTIALILRWKEFADLSGMGFMRSAPLTNLYESLVFFVWCLIAGYLIIEFKFKNRSFGAFITPIAGLALAFIDLTGVSKEIQPLVPALKSNWLLAHVTMSFIAYAAFSMSFSTGLMYLITTTEKRNELSYIFWTITFGIFAVVFAAMGIDMFTYKVAVKPDVFVKTYLFKTSFFSPSSFVKIVSWILGMATLFIIWRYGFFLKKVIEKFNVTADMLDEITYKSIALSVSRYSPWVDLFSAPFGLIRHGVFTGAGIRKKHGLS